MKEIFSNITIANLIKLLQVFSALLWATSPGGDSLPGIPRMEELRRIFPKDLEITWTVEADTFPRLKLLMNFREFFVIFGEGPNF